ncbi:MAG: MBL fold metallo-hydrolase [Saprospiraceae bacterium]|nr:MBL fold metallo-hydrolase [Saprospiraceae bacterium]
MGYDGSNASMVIGVDGVVIIDALRALGCCGKGGRTIREISRKPVKALIYTHGHEDHTGGASAFIEDSKDVQIIARVGFRMSCKSIHR